MTTRRTPRTILPDHRPLRDPGARFLDWDGDLFVVTSAERLIRVDWASRTIVPGWSFDLAPSGVRDSRGVSVILGSSASDDRYFVLDGGYEVERRPAPARRLRLQGARRGRTASADGEPRGEPGFETDLAGWSTAGSGTGVTPRARRRVTREPPRHTS